MDSSQRIIEDKIENVRKYNEKVSVILSRTIMWGMAVHAKKDALHLKLWNLPLMLKILSIG